MEFLSKTIVFGFDDASVTRNAVRAMF